MTWWRPLFLHPKQKLIWSVADLLSADERKTTPVMQPLDRWWSNQTELHMGCDRMWSPSPRRSAPFQASTWNWSRKTKRGFPRTINNFCFSMEMYNNFSNDYESSTHFDDRNIVCDNLFPYLKASTFAKLWRDLLLTQSSNCFGLVQLLTFVSLKDTRN